MPTVTKEAIQRVLDELPEESLAEVWKFLDYLRFKAQAARQEQVIGLGGLLEGYNFSEEEIAEARREMWGQLGEDD
ncbi:MAG TPA: hypothetical protein EYP55_10195 [Anaerolineae bacterium]|nr:hypothetical protein [Anaerolineae bacterium]